MMTKTLEIFQKRIPLYRKNIKLFAWEMFKFIPDKWQNDVFCDIVTDNRITVKSGQGVKDSYNSDNTIVVFKLFFISENSCNGSNQATTE